jgi:hypothetical protein
MSRWDEGDCQKTEAAFVRLIASLRIRHGHDLDVLPDEITAIDNALTRPWTVDASLINCAANEAEEHPRSARALTKRSSTCWRRTTTNSAGIRVGSVLDRQIYRSFGAHCGKEAVGLA